MILSRFYRDYVNLRDSKQFMEVNKSKVNLKIDVRKAYLENATFYPGGFLEGAYRERKAYGVEFKAKLIFMDDSMVIFPIRNSTFIIAPLDFHSPRIRLMKDLSHIQGEGLFHEVLTTERIVEYMIDESSPELEVIFSPRKYPYRPASVYRMRWHLYFDNEQQRDEVLRQLREYFAEDAKEVACNI